MVIVENEFGRVSKQELSTNSVSEPIDVLEIKHQKHHAKISLYGGQVITWQPNDHQPVLWLSDSAYFERGKAIRGGIPLCWPWFGPYKNTEQQGDCSAVANHGFARLKTWQLEQITVTANNVSISLILQGENESAVWPAKYLLKQELVFGDSFEQKLFMTNLSEEPIEYSGALHSYFAVSSPQSCQVSPISTMIFDNKITGECQCRDALVNCAGPIDRVYYGNATCQIVDSDWQRTIELSSYHCQQWVLWNPGAKIASNMTDIHAQGEQGFVCLEAANTENKMILPQATLIIGQKISVRHD